MISLKRALPYLLVALLCATGGYVLGIYQTYHICRRADHADSLLWLRMVHRFLDQKEYAQADKIALTGLSAHLAIIQAVDEQPGMSLYYVFPWTRNYFATLTEHSLQRTYDDFSQQTGVLTPEAMAYLKAHSGTPAETESHQASH